MSNYLDTTFSFYPARIHITQPLGTVTLHQFIEAQRNPKQSIKDVFNQIAQAEEDKDFKLKSDLKTNNLFYFNPCIQTDGLGRSYSNIKAFTGILALDIDHINNAEGFKQFLFNEFKSCICAYLSPSKKGVKALIRIPVVDSVDEFKSYFYGIASQLECYDGFDGSPQNPSLPLFLSWDENILWREDAEVWSMRGEKLGEFPTSVVSFEPLTEVNEEDREEVKSIVQRMVNKISDSGHFILRSASLLIGGFCGAGYISYEEAEDFMYELIEDNDYLSQKSSGYKKTAAQMILKGIDAPILLSKHQEK